jgi:hypothetical protein
VIFSAADVVGEVQQPAVLLHDVVRGFQADQHGIEQDQADHERLEPAGLDDLATAFFHKDLIYKYF